MKVSVVIPVYNSEKSIAELSHRLMKTLEGLAFEIILVDDGSSDGTRALIKSMAGRHGEIRYIFFDRNYGQQAAIFAGLRKSSGEAVITLDDDLQHAPEDIPMILALLEEYEGVFAFPEMKPHSGYRKLGSWMTHRLFNRLFSKDKELRISSFRGIRRALVDKMIAEETAFVYISALMIRHSHRLKTIYHQQYQRKHGDSNYSFKKLLALYLKILIHYGPLRGLTSSRPLYRILEEN
jgi:undecaprenyl-phosphate 4-deoxy-4-formamido-L-arabinose transferase